MMQHMHLPVIIVLVIFFVSSLLLWLILINMTDMYCTSSFRTSVFIGRTRESTPNSVLLRYRCEATLD